MPDVFLSVKVEGQEVGDLIEFIEVEENDMQSDLATLTFVDSNLILADVLHEGLSVEVDLGRTDVHAVVFRGIVTSIRGHFPSRGTPRVEIEASDNIIKLSMDHVTRRWWNTTLSQIVRDIALASGLAPGEIAISWDHPGGFSGFPRGGNTGK